LTEPAVSDLPAHETVVPRLTVLMPCWNAASTIEWALASVLEERGVSFECVVIDDDSTDGTADIVQAVADRDPRVVLIRLPTNVGVSNARNSGLAAAHGEWLAFHDADDRMLPGGLAALMRPTADPAVRAVVGQRIWSDGERTWLSPLYDIPDIRQPGRKSIATHPGLLYYASATGKAFHRSLLDGLQFEGRVLGDQAWTIRALLRAEGNIEVVGETVFEWSRPHPDRFVETITSVARASASGATEMTIVARTVFRTVCAEVDARIDDEATRDTIKRAYFERLIRSDLGGPVSKAIERRDPATGQLFDALSTFLEAVPARIIVGSDHLITSILQPPARDWGTLVRSARWPYWRMVRQVVRADRRMPRRIASRVRLVEPAFVFARLGEPVGPLAASAVLWIAVLGKRILDRFQGP
jgi:glycosyltransferase involved in cell wall biosynthesis